MQQAMAEVFTIEEWLAGMVDYDVPKTTMKAIMYNNGVLPGTDLSTLGDREKELCLADLYMWLSATSSATSGEYISDGGWQHQKANKVVVDRSGLRARAIQLYQKWDSDKASSANGGRIKIKHIY